MSRIRRPLAMSSENIGTRQIEFGTGPILGMHRLCRVRYSSDFQIQL